ncbi:MAG: VPLPA-CTERM sorting domain-containing protein [Pseudomonadota bacterium]
MNLKTLKGLTAVATLGLAAPAAMANVISLTPLTQIVDPGEEFTLEVRMDFLQETVGGAFDVFYDTALVDFVSFTYNDDFLANIVDPAFTLVPDVCETSGAANGGCSVGDAEINGIGFGNFDGILGSHLIGELTFTAGSEGLATFLTASSDSLFGGFISAATANELTVVYNGAAVLVTPIPAAVWMMLGGLGVLTRFRKRD